MTAGNPHPEPPAAESSAAKAARPGQGASSRTDRILSALQSAFVKNTAAIEANTALLEEVRDLLRAGQLAGSSTPPPAAVAKPGPQFAEAGTYDRLYGHDVSQALATITRIADVKPGIDVGELLSQALAVRLPGRETNVNDQRIVAAAALQRLATHFAYSHTDLRSNSDVRRQLTAEAREYVTTWHLDTLLTEEEFFDALADGTQLAPEGSNNV